MSREVCRLEEGHNWFLLECRLSAGKLFPAKTTKMLSTRNLSILMMSSSEYLFLKSFWHDQTCRPIKISVLRMRVALMIITE